jgi:dolichol-phosphate mannosyltransferase
MESYTESLKGHEPGRLPAEKTAAAIASPSPKVAVVIPCYRVKAHILGVLAGIGPEVDWIVVVDDRCPEESGKFVEEKSEDPRVVVVYHSRNRGVGGATKTGMQTAIRMGAQILVKLDGDGQMDASQIESLIAPIRHGLADYTKGNRFYSPRALKQMPITRLIGNAGLSFLTKLSTGYWGIMDPTNGFLAIHAKVFSQLETEHIEDRFFFETDMLFRLHLSGAVVVDVPLPAKYGEEESNLRIGNALFTFAAKHIQRFFKRLGYDYFVHDVNVGSVQLVAGALGFGYGLISGLYTWYTGNQTGQAAETGTIMISMIPLILGFQLLLSALNYDISRREEKAIHPFL